MEGTNIKYFTPKDAEKTHPLVKKIVKDILEKGYELRTIAESTGGKIDDNSEAKYLIEQINVYMKELEEIGCYYKDWNFNIGLVDFPSVIDGEEVFLCWRSDEESIEYYHPMSEGYAGRRKIPEDYF